jgi:hypothetical protein
MKRRTREHMGEHLVALGAVVVGVLVGILALQTGMGLLNAAGAAFIGYVAAVAVAVAKLPLNPGRVVALSAKGAVVTTVVTVILVIGFARAFRGLV